MIYIVVDLLIIISIVLITVLVWLINYDCKAYSVLLLLLSLLLLIVIINF